MISDLVFSWIEILDKLVVSLHFMYMEGKKEEAEAFDLQSLQRKLLDYQESGRAGRDGKPAFAR